MNQVAALKKADKPAKVKAERKPRDTLTIVQRTDLANLIRLEYANSGMTDAEFANMATSKIGHAVSIATVASYRTAYGIAAPGKLTLSEARARIRALGAEVARLSAPQGELVV